MVQVIHVIQMIQVRADSDAQKPDSSRYCNRLHPDPFNGSTFPSALSDFVKLRSEWGGDKLSVARRSTKYTVMQVKLGGGSYDGEVPLSAVIDWK